ncbi:hypothetical protein tb265_44730 [Gemmatimonadetes bacterium T265]|nr:hypothetical protein tb265_44730 [Gemmatimonadetes bacterium T265]
MLPAARLARGRIVPVLVERLLLPLPHWVAYEDATDTWQQSVGGQEAKRILEEAEAVNAGVR